MPDVSQMLAKPQTSIGAFLGARIGHVTGSNIKRIVQWGKGGPRRCSDTIREKYLMEVVGERMTDIAVSHYVTDAMQWGIDHEAEAKAVYEGATGFRIDPAEFMLHKDLEYFGGTPDGLIEQDGLIEVKCPATTTYVDWRLVGKVPDEHKPQMAAYVLITGRPWCDFVAYDPRVKQPHARLFVRRYKPTVDELTFLYTEIDLFLKQVELIFRQTTENI